MALTRKMLKAFNLDEAIIEQIIEAHTESTDALKQQRDEYKAKADAADGVSAELEKLKGEIAKQPDYAALKKEYDEYKLGVENKEANAKKHSALVSLVKDTGIKGDKLIDTIAKGYDLSKIELDDSGAIKTADDISAAIKTEWADYVPTSSTSGANVDHPPKGSGGHSDGITKDEIMKIKDSRERVRMIAEHRDLFE